MWLAGEADMGKKKSREKWWKHMKAVEVFTKEQEDLKGEIVVLKAELTKEKAFVLRLRIKHSTCMSKASARIILGGGGYMQGLQRSSLRCNTNSEIKNDVESSINITRKRGKSSKGTSHHGTDESKRVPVKLGRKRPTTTVAIPTRHFVGRTGIATLVARCPLQEDFEARLSQAMSEVGSTTGTSECTPLNPIEEERLRSRCWNAAVGGKYKERHYGTGDLYESEDGSFVGAYSSLPQNTQEIAQLTQRVLANEEQMRQMHSQYQTQFQSLHS
ncbi:hypothetical protein Fmac_006184 [Flemingia macrophylla]|uniref:Uncharacterized protein n=1 Tax=Flemingia macrophylla TaxID=520843 RepID=A0ABD1N9V2_9FABA